MRSERTKSVVHQKLELKTKNQNKFENSSLKFKAKKLKIKS